MTDPLERISTEPGPTRALRKVLAGFVRQLLGRSPAPTDTHLRLLK